jgi:hypothetical protein
MKARAKLWQVINSAGLSAKADDLFLYHPILEKVSTNFVQYVTPLLQVDGKGLAVETIKKAFAACENIDDSGKPRAFIESIVGSADVLKHVRVSVQDCDGLWMIWSYNEPLQQLLDQHRANVLQIKHCPIPAKRMPLLVKMLAAISSTEHMETAGLNIGQIFAGEGV